MIIEKITAEDIKYFTNEAKLSDIKKLGFEKYVSIFLNLAKKSKDIAPLVSSIRVNGEQIDLSGEYQIVEEEIIESKRSEFIKKLNADDSACEMELVFAYSAFSNFDHNYLLKTKEDKLLYGIECESFSFDVEDENVPYQPLTSTGKMTCDNVQLTLVNEEANEVSFSYPRLEVYIKGYELPVISIDFWEDELLDVLEPEENLYLEQEKVITTKISAVIEEKLETAITSTLAEITA